MIIDVHAHVYACPRIIPRWAMTTFMPVDEQIKMMDAKGVDKAIILPLNSPECPSEVQSIGEVLWLCEQYPGRFIPFCNLDPRIARRPDLITVDDYLYFLAQYKALGCKGVGEFVPRLPFDHPLMLKMFEACEKVGFPITFHTITEDVNSYGIIDEIGLPRFTKVLERFANLKFFGHSQGFWSEIGGELTPAEKNGYPVGPVKPGGKIPELMRKHKNLYGDLSAGSGLNALQRDPEHAFRFIEEFQDQLLLGLDYCSVNNDMQHIEWLKQQRDAGHISSQAYEKITWQNINRALNLGLA